MTIHGSQFTTHTTVSLVPDGRGQSISATRILYQDSSTLFATFNLQGASAGSYDVRVVDGSQTATESGGFTVAPGGSPGSVTVSMTEPSSIRAGFLGTVTITYSNTGGSDVPAPLLELSADNATFQRPGGTDFVGNTVSLLAINTSGPAGVLPAGYSGSISVRFIPTTNATFTYIHFSLQVVDQSVAAETIDWSSLKSSLQPSYIPASAWNAVYVNLTNALGSTAGSYVSALDADATYLSQLGEYTIDAQRLFGFEIAKADASLSSGALATVTDTSFPVPGAIPLEFDRQFNDSISARDTMGPFGLGWTDNWQITATTDSSGDVSILDDGSIRFFLKQADGSYADSPGEFATLTLVNGAYELRETDGTILAFNPNGSLAYEQDKSGNRITPTYSGSELTRLTASNGSAISIQSNVQGLISSITDPAGRTTSYTYDASGQHLLTFTDEFGKTTYTYAAGPTAADQNALTSITFADGTGLAFSYDAEGRLATSGRLGGAETVTYAYPSTGGFTVTDADGNTATHLFDDAGNCCTIIDPLGNITRYSFDAHDNLVKVVAADGTTTTYAYDSSGNLTSETDPLGYTIEFTYNQFGEPLTDEDQNGNTTLYQYDAHGNLIQTTYADGTAEHYAYNALGEVTQSIDARGQATSYSYNANGQLTSAASSDSSVDTYTYDAHANLLTAAGPGGTWSFAYNDQDLPTQIIEPNGSYSIAYGIDGNVTQVVDQTGFTENYVYNVVGRLAKLTDVQGNLIESYMYDRAGNIVSEAKGNGTSTTYQYNADGDITQITNFAPGGQTVNSRIAYAYNAVGQVSSMAAGGVTTAYRYDGDGQLIAAVSPGESLQYAYDPAGNRTSTTDNGVVTNYDVNNRDEYTQAGDASYTYDADGNMTSATTNGVTTTYAYNSLDQLTGVQSPTDSFSYVYDPLGFRVSATFNGRTTNNLIDPIWGTVGAQLGGSEKLIEHYTYGLGLVSQVSASGTESYYDFNLQGSTVAITNTEGSYINQYAYDPFGQVTTISAGNVNPFTFVGQFGVSNDGSGFFDMRARDYDPVTGQFLSNDPLGFVGGDTNFRVYASNDPARLIDPSGLAPIPGTNEFFIDHERIYFDWTFTRGDAFDFGSGFTVPNIWKYLLAPPFNWLPGYNPWKGLSSPYRNDPFWHIHYNIPWPKLPPRKLPQWLKPPPWLNRLRLPWLPGRNGGGGQTGAPRGNDPNDIIGPSGFVTSGQVLPYEIAFQNEPNATGSAQVVVISEQLDSNLDWSTFQLGSFGFGQYTVTPPPGLASYSTRIDARATVGLFVDVDASFSRTTGVVTWTFTSIDPTTLDVTADPLAGFLPPDTDPPAGDGSVSYTIEPKATDATGTVLKANASVVFDLNKPVATETISSTIDATPPTSRVNPLPAAINSTSFTVSWTGSDGAGSGIAGYNVYVSDDGGPFRPFRTGTTATSATFTGQVGHTYAFFSVATSNVGLVQADPTAAQATTKVVKAPLPAPPVIVKTLHWGTIQVRTGSGRTAKTKSETALEIQFSGPVTGAGNLAAYHLSRVTTKKMKKKSVTTLTPIQLSLALPGSSPTTISVALVPAGKINLAQTDELVIIAADLTDCRTAEALDGNRDGKPGGNFVSTLGKSGLLFARVRGQVRFRGHNT